jgi:glycosyltransferase involved in cell wall biosynthesis
MTVHFIHFVLHGLEKTVVDSQLIVPAVRLNDAGVPVQLVIMEDFGTWLKLYSRSEADARRHRVKGLKLLTLPRIPRNILYLNTLLLVFITLRRILNGDSFVVHARGLQGAAHWLPLKRFFKKVKIICDVRGVESDEYAYTCSHGGKRPLNIFQKIWKRHLDGLTASALRKSDAVLFVSKAMGAYLKPLSGLSSFDHWSYLPCSTVVDDFKSAHPRRDEIRKEQGWENRVVVIYSGAYRNWQMPELSVRCAALLRELDSRVFFLCLTPDVEVFKRITAEAGFTENDSRVKHLPFDQMPGMLVAGDLALLLRRESPVNKFSCPTKFAEYISANLTVLTTGAIADIVELVQDRHVGWVLQHLDNLKDLKNDLSIFLKGWSADDKKHSKGLELAQNHFNWDLYVPFLKKLYLDLGNK